MEQLQISRNARTASISLGHFLNLLANAIDALEEAWNKDQRELVIQIRTEQLDQTAVIRISDNALGIPAEIQRQLFQPMFTTKPLGKGTGLGLSISRQIMQEKHHGQRSCHSVLGEGSEFRIELPLL